MLVHISKFDVYKSGKALYHVDRVIREVSDYIKT